MLKLMSTLAGSMRASKSSMSPFIHAFSDNQAAGAHLTMAVTSGLFVSSWAKLMRIWASTAVKACTTYTQHHL
jgi:hypothetical protein